MATRFGEYENRGNSSASAPYSIRERQIAVPVAEAELPTQMVAPRPEELHIETLSDSLNYCLTLVDDELMKGYITRLDKLEVVPAEFDGVGNMLFFRIDELVYEDEEFSTDKLSTVFHALSNKPCTIALMIKSDGSRNSLYLGVRSDSDEFSSGTMLDLLRQTFIGQFPGSKTTDHFDASSDITNQNFHSISSVSCVSDFRQEKQQLDNKQFIQSIEKFLVGMSGKEYTAVILAQNILSDELNSIRQQYENIYSQISPFAEMQLNFTVNQSSSAADSTSENMGLTHTTGTNSGGSMNTSTSKGISDGTTVTTGHSDTKGTSTTVTDGTSHTVSEGTSKSTGTSETETKGSSNSVSMSKSFGMSGGVSIFGMNAGFNSSTSVGVSHSNFKSKSLTKSVTDTVSKSVSDSISHSVSRSSSNSHTVSKSQGSTHVDSTTETTGSASNWGESDSLSSTLGLARSNTLTDTLGTGQGIVLNARNRQIKSVLDRLDKQIQRMDECESIGMWECSAYFLGTDRHISESAANMYLSLVSGTGSGIERSAVNTWSNARGESEHSSSSFPVVKAYTEKFCVPMFKYGTDGQQVVSPASLVSTSELAIQMGLPKRSVRGLPVSEHVVFGQEIISGSGLKNELPLGRVFHLNTVMNEPVRLDLQSLSMHTFVTGSTGSGKSNTVYGLIGRAMDKGIPFLVIEPAKGEYKNVFGHQRGVTVLGTNPSVSALLKINPFSFPKNIHVLEHIDRLIEIFNVCWSMTAAMPAVLKDSVIRAYQSCGWDLDNSVNRYSNNLFPCFEDLLRQIQNVVRCSAYSDEVKGNYIGSLETRVRSLTNGLNGNIFSSDETDNSILFDSPVIVDLSRIGSQETKALIMGVLVMKLNEYRMSNADGMNCPLRHLTVLEEAHNLLKRTSSSQNPESPNTMGKSVEMLANSIAEMRTYGEGFIIADQSPNALDSSAIRNTNTKIIMRLPDEADRHLAGKSAAFTDKQLDELARLPRGVAAVYQNDWHEPVLCMIEKWASLEKPYRYTRPKPTTVDSRLRAKIARLLINGKSGNYSNEDIRYISSALDGSHYSTTDKIVFYRLLDELKRHGTLRLWNDDHLHELAQMVKRALCCTDADISEAVYSACTLDEAYENISRLTESRTDLAGSVLGRKIDMCLIECFRTSSKLASEISAGLCAIDRR